jgi:hypothetical protein
MLAKGRNAIQSLKNNQNRNFVSFKKHCILMQSWAMKSKAIKLALRGLLVENTKLTENPINTKCAIRDTQYAIRVENRLIFDTK